MKKDDSIFTTLGENSTTEPPLLHIKKLEEVSERGYAIFFFRDTASADTRTESRRKTEEKIERILRRPFESEKVGDNVRVLCFLLRLARKNRRIFGKCEVYNPTRKEWKKVNMPEAK